VNPREVIARALHRADVEPRRFDPHYYVHEWDDLRDPAKVYWHRLADAVIDALEKMDVTAKMWGAGVEAANAGGVEEIWFAMVGAMKEE